MGVRFCGPEQLSRLTRVGRYAGFVAGLRVMAIEQVFPAWVSDAQIGLDAAAVPSCLTDAIWSGVLWQGAADAFLMEIPDAARIFVTRRGFSLALGADVEFVKIAGLLRRTPFAAYCWLNGLYACQGVALAGPDGAVAILGGSGIGKSSLALLLMQRGLRLLCDDLVPLKLAADGTLSVMPVWPELSLMPAKGTALADGIIPPWLERREGDIFDLPYWNVAAELYCAEPLALKRVYCLKRTGRNEETGEQVSGGLQGFVTGDGGLEPYHRIVAYALRTQGLALRYYGAVSRGMPIRIFKVPVSDGAGLDDVADDILSECGWANV